MKKQTIKGHSLSVQDMVKCALIARICLSEPSDREVLGHLLGLDETKMKGLDTRLQGFLESAHLAPQVSLN